MRRLRMYSAVDETNTGGEEHVCLGLSPSETVVR